MSKKKCSQHRVVQLFIYIGVANVYTCPCAQVCLPMCVYVETRGQLWVSYSTALHLIFSETGSQGSLKLVILATLPGQQVPQIYASALSCSTGLLRCRTRPSAFTWVLGLTQIVILAQQALWPLSYLLSLPPRIFYS